MRNTPRLELKRIVGFFFLAALLRLVWLSHLNGQDFEVYWHATREWWAGRDPYAVDPTRLGFVFKYPPWLLPIFLPLAVFSFEAARWVWAAVQSAAWIYTFRWVRKQGVGAGPLLVSAGLFFWIWAGHFSAGQITLPMLALALAGFSAGRAELVALALSAKVFSLVSLGGLPKKTLQKPRAWIAGLSALALLHAVLLFAPIPLAQLYRGWLSAATSGGVALGESVVRGQGNHGLTALVLRWFSVPSEASQADVLVFALLAVFLGALWQKLSRRLSEAERWAGWLALGVIVHPLAWHHSFVLAFPLCALSFQAACERRARVWIVLSVMGMVCIGILIPQILGSQGVRSLELAGVKSWGVLLSAWALLGARIEEEPA